MTGIAISRLDVPMHLHDRLRDRLYRREDRDEYQFHWWQQPNVLPVQWEGGLQLLTWGCLNQRSRLPHGGWLLQEDLVAGILGNTRVDPALIPANLGFDRGTWFLIDEGVQGVVLSEVANGPIVYVLTQPSSNYYRNMTGQSPVMPVFAHQVI